MSSSHRWRIDLDSYDPWGSRTVHCVDCGAYWGETHPEWGDKRAKRIPRKCVRKRA